MTLVSAGLASSAHPSVFPGAPIFSTSAGSLRVTDALASGAATLDDDDGLFRVRFTVAADTVGEVPLLFVAAFTNLADELGDALPIARLPGTITVTELAAPHVVEVLVRGSQWSTEFLNHVHAAGLGYSVPSGTGQLADLPWTNVDQIVVRFSEGVSVQQNDLVLHGVNTTTYATSGFSYNATKFTATWTLGESLAVDKLLIELAAGGGDPIRNAAGVRLDGDWSDGTSAFPSGNGRSGGNFRFRVDVLPGNVDQLGPANIFDTIKTRNRQFTSIGHENYNALYDVNGGGQINIFDTILVRNRQFTSLPEAEPAPSPPLTASAPSPVGVRSFVSAAASAASRSSKLVVAAGPVASPTARRLDARLVAEVFRAAGAAEEGPAPLFGKRARAAWLQR